MARRRVIAKREILPDPIYGSSLVSKFINHMMIDGKKSVAETIVRDAFDIIADKSNADPLNIFEKALDNLRPRVELKLRRVGGATYQIPIDVRPTRQTTLAMRFLIKAARRRPEKGMARRLAAEILAAFDKTGLARKAFDELARMAAANQAFSHYR